MRVRTVTIRFPPSSSHTRTPAESIYHLSPFVLAITGMIFLAVFNSGTPSRQRNYAMSLNQSGLLPGRRAPFVRRSHAVQDSTGPSPAGSLCPQGNLIPNQNSRLDARNHTEADSST